MAKTRSRPSNLDAFLRHELAEALSARDEARATHALDTYFSNGQVALPGMGSVHSDPDKESKKKVLDLLTKLLPNGIPSAALRGAYSRRPDIYFLVSFLVQKGPAAIQIIEPEPFTAVQPAQSIRYNSGEEALARAGTGAWLVEPKLDGWECQIHSRNGIIRVFSRTGEDWTGLVLDVIEVAKQLVASHAAILEGELLAVDPRTGKDLPRLQMRVAEIAHRAVLFDIMYWDGDQTRNTCVERFRLLTQIFRDYPNDVIRLTEQVRTDSQEEFLACFDAWRTAGLEGMIAKRPDAIYEAGRRTNNRIKIKPLDTVDALLIGYNSENQTYLAAVLDDDRHEFVPFAWIHSAAGLKAESQAELKELRLKAHDRTAKPISVAGKVADVMLNPLIVAEIGGDHIHPANYPCGVTLTGRGWSLHGAKFIRLREDKQPEDVTTLREFLTLPVMAGHIAPDLEDHD